MALAKLNHHRVGPLEIISCLPKNPNSLPPLLFVHGAFAGAWVWGDNFLPWFAQRGYRAYAVSLRGHGESEGQGRLDHLGIADYVDDVIEAVTWLEEAPILVGHSMGGYVVQKYIERHRVPAAVLLCSVPPQGLLAAQFHLIFKRPGLFMEINKLLSGRNVALDVVQEALFAQPVSQEILQRFYVKMQRESNRAIWDMTLFHVPNWFALPRPPLLVMGAEEDLLVPAFLVQSTARSYGVGDVILRGMGHGLTHEPDWTRVTEAIDLWLSALKEVL